MISKKLWALLKKFMSRSTNDRLICDLFEAILTTVHQEIPELKESDFFINMTVTPNVKVKQKV